MKYDHEYRLSQAEQGFRWGADNSYLMQVILKPDMQKMNKNTAYSSKSRTNSRNPRGRDVFDPRTGRPICRNWNKEQGCSLPVCNFSHVCIVCFKSSHNGVNHRTGPQPPVSHNAGSQDAYREEQRPVSASAAHSR